MSLSRFFIDRPVFAWVIGILITLIGTVVLFRMPIAQYPSIAPPMVTITVVDPGASAETVNNTVVQPILQQMYGVDHLEYIASTSYGSGEMEIDLTFQQGTNPDIAQVQVQNRLQLAQPRLPPEVVAQGMSVTKGAKSYMMFLAFVSKDGSMSGHDVADYLASNITDPISRLNGVGMYTMFGSEYAMRIWMNPDSLTSYGLSVSDVEHALQAQNIQIAAGELGGLPAAKGIQLDATIIGPTRLNDPSQFEKILLKTMPNGSAVFLKDVAKVGLGPSNYSLETYYNNHPSAGLGIKLAPGANQLLTQDLIAKKLKELSKFFPPGLTYYYPLDTKPFITHSIEEVVETLVIAILLVVVVILVFLQNLRATLIPSLAVPIVLLGTFGILGLMGFTINTLTLLAMVLAVGLLVDDAIVVVENVERVMDEKKLSPRDAARESMDEITGALVGIVLVLTAVFLPMAAFSGSTGVIYRQFSVTIVVAMWLSLVVALVMTPSLCATILKPHSKEKHKPRNIIEQWAEYSAERFNYYFEKTTEWYIRGVKLVLKLRLVMWIVFIAVTASVVVLFNILPTGFLPGEDQGLVFGQATLPPNTPQEKTNEVNKMITSYVLNKYKNEVESVFATSGYNFAGQGQNAGAFFIKLKPWSQRPKSWQSSIGIAAEVMKHFSTDPHAQIFALNPPAVLELGEAEGFDLELLNQSHMSHADFLEVRNKFLRLAAQNKKLMAVRPMGMEDAGQYVLDIDRQKANAMHLNNDEINTTIEGAFGSIYVNQFTRNNRVKQVYIQGEPNSRMTEEQLKRWYLKNNLGQLVPLSSFVSAHWVSGPQKVENYNGIPAFEIQGQAAPGVSSGDAMKEVYKILAQMPPGVGHEWTGLSYEEIASQGATGPLYALASVIILLCLAALYESWTIPLAVMLVVPLGVLGAVVTTLLRGYANDVYFQIGVLTTVGLAIKNAILIIEFARDYFDKGMDLVEAVLLAAHQRLRPILMTSFAFVCGVLPLAIATGAGATARRAIGTCVVGGMFSATIFVVYFVPLFFVCVLKLFRVTSKAHKEMKSKGA